LFDEYATNFRLRLEILGACAAMAVPYNAAKTVYEPYFEARFSQTISGCFGGVGRGELLLFAVVAGGGCER